MFSGISRMFGIVGVTEKNGIIKISGVPADIIARILNAEEGMRKIHKAMLLPGSDKNNIVIPSFFAIEFAWVIENVALVRGNYRYHRVLRKILDLLMENTWLKTTKDDPPSCIDLSYLASLTTWTPKTHQYDFLEQVGKLMPKYSVRGYLLASPPGSGKTAMDLFMAGCLVPRELAEVKIIISPKNATELVWGDTIRKFFKKTPTYWISSNPGPAPIGLEYYIFHYESLDRAVELAMKLHAQGKRYFVIVDESHNFNTDEAQRTKNLVSLCRGSGKYPVYSVWASGSPIKAQGTEMIPLLRSIDNFFTDTVAKMFKKIYSVDADVARRMLAHRLGNITFKVDKTSVVNTLQPAIKLQVKLKNPTPYLTVTVQAEMKAFMEERFEFYKKDMDAYRRDFDECIAYHRRTLRTTQQIRAFDDYMYKINYLKVQSQRGVRPDVKDLAYCKTYELSTLIPSLTPAYQKKFKASRSIVKSLVMKVQGEALGNILAKRRSECATALGKACQIENIINGAMAKTMVFTSYVKTLTAMMDHLKELGFTPSAVYGGTNKELDSIIDQFYKNDDINPIAATYKSLSTAVPVICANTIVMVDVPPRQYIYDQTVARIDRLGQVNPTFVYELYLDTGKESNISTSIGDILRWSAEMAAAYLGEEVPADDKLIETVSE